MTAPDKPGLSNEEFIKKWRRMTMSDLSLAQRRGEDAEAFWQALDRLEALIGQGKPTPGQIGADKYELGSFINYVISGTRLNTLREVFVANAAYRRGQEVLSGQGSLEQPWSGLKRINGLSETPGQGQEERDYTPEWVKVKFSDERYHELLDLIDSLPMPSRKGVCVNDTNLLRDYLMDSFGAIKHLASADKALCGQGKPTPGQIGLVDGDKLIEKLTIESALTRETPEGKGWIEAMNAVKYWTRLGDFSVSGQGQEERDRKVFEAGYEAFCTKHYTLDQAWDDFAAADAAKKEGGK